MAVDRSKQSSEQQQQGTQSLTRPSQGQGRPVYRGSPFGAFGGDLISMSPFALLRAMTEEMDRTFTGSGTRSAGGGGLQSWMPAMEVREKNGNLVVCADLPGIDKNDVKLEVTDDMLTIEGERKKEHEEGHGQSHKTERSYGHFYRAIQLPEGAKADQAKAEFRNGVLEVTVPVEQPKPNRHQIQIEDKSK